MTREVQTTVDFDYLDKAFQGLFQWKNNKIGDTLKPNSLWNAQVYLSQVPKLRGLFRQNKFSDQIMVMRTPPWSHEDVLRPRPITNDDMIQLMAWLERMPYPLDMSQTHLQSAIRICAITDSYHPVMDFFEQNEWDRKPRLDNWLTYYLGAEDQSPQYLAKVGASWLIAAVARVYTPGAFFKAVLVLEGLQDSGKSSALKCLTRVDALDDARAYFIDQLSFSMLERQHLASELQGALIIEFAEMTGFSKRDRNEIKQFISQTHDRVLKKYENVVTEYPRQFVIAVTTNEDKYLNDPTGSVRFWPVRVGTIDIEALHRDRAQLWAEAVHRYKAGTPYWIEATDTMTRALMEAEQMQRFDADIWQEPIGQYFKENPLDRLTVKEVAVKALYYSVEKLDNRVQARIRDVLKSLGLREYHAKDEDRRTIRKWGY